MPVLRDLSDETRITKGQIMNVKKINDLRKLCKKLGLPAGGTKHDLTERLEANQNSRADRFGPGKLKCQICSMPAKVTGTRREPRDDGKVVITRQVVCTGKHRHTYPLKEVI